MGIPARDAVDLDILCRLEGPDGPLGQRAEDPIGLQFAVPGPVQGQLQKLHPGPDAPPAQDSHKHPLLFRAVYDGKIEIMIYGYRL